MFYIFNCIAVVLIILSGSWECAFAGKSHKPKASKQHAKAYGDDEPVLLDGEPMILNSKKVIKYSKMKRAGYDEKYADVMNVDESSVSDDCVTSVDADADVEMADDASDIISLEPGTWLFMCIEKIYNAKANGSLNTFLSTDPFTYIHIACCSGFTPDFRGSEGETALHKAAAYDMSDWVEALINLCGCDVMARDSQGNTPLHAAAICDADKAIDVLMFYGKRYYSEVRNNDGFTALHLAAYYNSAAAARMLCERGADVCARGFDGYTALEVAMMRDDAAKDAFIALNSFIHQYDCWDRKPENIVEKRTHPQLFVDTTRH
jgi:hypothetical protein